jgi:hypothetical protein
LQLALLMFPAVEINIYKSLGFTAY